MNDTQWYVSSAGLTECPSCHAHFALEAEGHVCPFCAAPVATEAVHSARSTRPLKRIRLGRGALVAASLFGLSVAAGCGGAQTTGDAPPTAAQTEPAADEKKQEEVGPGTALEPKDFAPTPKPDAPADDRTVEEKRAAALSFITADCVETMVAEYGMPPEPVPDRVVPAVEARAMVTDVDRDDDTYAYFWIDVVPNTDLDRGVLVEATGEMATLVDVRPSPLRAKLRVTLEGAEGLESGSEVIVGICQW